MVAPCLWRREASGAWSTLETPYAQGSRENCVRLLSLPGFLSHLLAEIKRFLQVIFDPTFQWRVRFDKVTSSSFLILPWHLSSNEYCPWKWICRRSSTQAWTNLQPVQTGAELVLVSLSFVFIICWIWCVWYTQSPNSENGLKINLINRNKCNRIPNSGSYSPILLLG